ncbi:MAG: Rrf2 family transcriptional regulator [Desulfobacterales bacterium]|jgi:Rrf2 family protein
MINTQKNQYAIRAVFELAKHRGQGPIKIHVIAQAQKIPTRFLEIILNQLKHGGLLESKRGFYGGYTLIRPPSEITVGEIVRLMDRSSESLYRMTGIVRDDNKYSGDGIFLSMWTKAHKAMIDVLDNTTIQNLLEQSSLESG